MSGLRKVINIGILGLVVALAGPALKAAPEAHPEPRNAASTEAKPIQMEFSVVETEADGSRHVIASPRVLTQDKQDATVRVRTDAGRGLNLAVIPTRLDSGLVKLNVACRTWHVEHAAAGAGADKVQSRELHQSVVVAEGKRISLKNPSDERLTLELEVHQL